MNEYFGMKEYEANLAQEYAVSGWFKWNPYKN